MEKASERSASRSCGPSLPDAERCESTFHKAERQDPALRGIAGQKGTGGRKSRDGVDLQPPWEDDDRDHGSLKSYGDKVLIKDYTYFFLKR